MIPELPNSVSLADRLDFYAAIAGNLSDQSSIHTNWHTHRQNPSVCWICDLNILTSKILDAVAINTKSSLDMETESSSDNESDSEIEDSESEDSLNYDEEEPVPEYETLPESDEPEQVGDQ